MNVCYLLFVTILCYYKCKIRRISQQITFVLHRLLNMNYNNALQKDIIKNKTKKAQEQDWDGTLTAKLK